ncbi:MAG: PQQ-dependent sugar dehydrogenase [Reichenbachiella sp.]
MENIFKEGILVLLMLGLFSCTGKKKEAIKSEPDVTKEVIKLNDISDIILPEGFKIEVYAEGVEDARSMVLGDQGTLFVGSRNAKSVYAVVDRDKDQIADTVIVIASGLHQPNGVAIRKGALYVAEIERVTVYDDIENRLFDVPEPKVLYDDYSENEYHGWRYIAFGPDDKLYVPIGATCNSCENEDENFATITRMNPDGSGREIFAKGVRNSVGMTWHPETGDMWFTDNGRDMLGDNFPPCELNKAAKAGMHFGFPYCHGGDISDPDLGLKFSCGDFTAPARKLGPHVAPLGLKFYTGEMFPKEYHGDILIPEHGSWNRTKKIGYRIMRVKIKDNKAVSYDVFAEGWLNESEQEAWGRPVDLLVMPDGSLLVSDDKGGRIFRISYKTK